MYQISQHFSLEEFQKDSDIPQECIEAFTALATSVLDPVRDWCAAPFLITSGYRDVPANTAANGQPNSEHIATADWCAADFYCRDKTSESIFDWMRNNPSLPFHQLILERGQNGSSVVHVSWNRLKPGVRSVLQGATHNTEPYLKVDYVPYAPINHGGKLRYTGLEGTELWVTRFIALSRMTLRKGNQTNVTNKIRRLLVTSLLALFCCSLGAAMAEPQIREIAKEGREDRSAREPKPPKPLGKSNVEKGKLGNPNKLAGSMARGNGTSHESAGEEDNLQKKDSKPPDDPPGPSEGAIDARNNRDEGRESSDKDTPLLDSLLLMLVVAIAVALAAIPRLLTRLQRPDPRLVGFPTNRIRPKP